MKLEVKDLNILQQYSVLRTAEYLVNEVDEPEYDSIEEAVEFVLEDILYTYNNNEEPNEVFELYLEFFVDLREHSFLDLMHQIPSFLNFTSVGNTNIIDSYDDKPEQLSLDVDEYIRQGRGGRWYVYKLKEYNVSDYLLPWTEGILTLEGYCRSTFPHLDLLGDIEDWRPSFRSIRGTIQEFMDKNPNKIFYKAYCEVSRYWKIFAVSKPIEVRDGRICYKD